MMSKRILLPTDGSDTAEQATHVAIDLAQKFSAELHVLSNIEILPFGLTPDTVRKIKHEYQNEAREILEEIKETAERNDVRTRTRVTSDRETHEAILDYADQHDINLIVMGTHGRSGLHRLMMGSTTERVLRKSPIPVVAVPAE